MKKKLPIILPLITSHHFYALPLAIIGTAKTSANWMYSEFLQLFTFRGKEDEYTCIHFYNYKNDMFTYDPLDDIRIQPKLLIWGDNIINTYKYFLNSDQYIYDFIDKYYIKSLKISWHHIHDLLIYGYDDNKQIFNQNYFNLNYRLNITKLFYELMRINLFFSKNPIILW